MNEAMPIRKDLAARGFSLERFVTRTAYARNGNNGHGTPEYTWVLKLNGKTVGMAPTKRGALDMAEDGE